MAETQDPENVTKAPDGVLSIPLSTFALSVRTSNVLRNANIVYLGDLMSWTETGLMGLQNCGKKSVAELRCLLADQGLCFGTISGWRTQGPGEVLGGMTLEPDIAAPRQFRDYGEELRAKFFLRVSDLRLSVRANNVLVACGIQFVGELVQRTSSQVARLQGCGKNSLEEIVSRLETLGLSLSVEIADWDRKIAEDANDAPGVELLAAQAEAQATVVPEFQASCLEDELTGLVGAFVEGRNAEMLVKLFGWSGGGRRTLDSVGQEYGITRERVRQIAARTVNQIRANKIELPWLTRALNAARQVGPLTSKELAKLLRKARISRADFDPSGLEAACEELGFKIGLDRRLLAGQYVYGKPAALSKLLAVLKLSKRMTAARGCANFDSLCDEVGITSAERDGARYMISKISSVVWLDDDKRWLFSKAISRNRLTNIVAKVLHVAQIVHLSELRRAAAKSRRLQTVPPARVLAKFLELNNLASVTGDEVTAKQPFNDAIERGSIEAIMLRVFRERGTTLRWDQLQEFCIAEGMNPVSCGIYMSISPIVTRVVRGVYALVGAKIEPGVVEDIVAEIARTRRRADSGWTSRGTLWAAIQINRNTLTSGATNLPSFATGMVEGKEWEIQVAGKPFGTILKARNNFVWSLAKPLERLGAEISDMCILDFNLAAKTVEILVGGEDLVDAWESGDIDQIEREVSTSQEADIEEIDEELSPEG